MDIWNAKWESSLQGRGALIDQEILSHDEKERFQAWRTKTNSDVLDRGHSPAKDFEEEQKYIQRMVKTVLRSHICYREVDDYADCLMKHKLVTDSEISQKGLVDVNMRLAQEKCPRQVAKYQSCIQAKANHQTVISAATTHSRCERKRKEFLICLGKNNKSEDLQYRNCYHDVYFPLLRCGLNALFDEYWKGVTGFSPANELHQYEMEHDNKIAKSVQELRQKLENESHLPLASDQQYQQQRQEDQMMRK